jgi:hypothetical protein
VQYKRDIWFNGDADTFFPIVLPLPCGTGGVLKVWRDYGEPAPDSWYDATTKGSMLLELEAGNRAWGSRAVMFDVKRYWSFLCRLVGKVQLTEPAGEAVIVWLRGGGTGGALYHFEASFPLEAVTDTDLKGRGADGSCFTPLYQKTQTFIHDDNRYNRFVEPQPAAGFVPLADINYRLVGDHRLLAREAGAGVMRGIKLGGGGLARNNCVPETLVHMHDHGPDADAAGDPIEKGHEHRPTYFHIHTPITRNSHTMFRFKIEGYLYSSCQQLDITFCGYTYPPTSAQGKVHCPVQVLNKGPDNVKLRQYYSSHDVDRLTLAFGPVCRYCFSFSVKYQGHGANVTQGCGSYQVRATPIEKWEL